VKIPVNAKCAIAAMTLWEQPVMFNAEVVIIIQMLILALVKISFVNIILPSHLLIACPPECTACSGPTTCTVCIDSYYLDPGVCSTLFSLETPP